MKRMARMMLMNNKPDRRDDRDRPRERPQEMGYAGFPPYPIYGGDRENGYGGPEDRFRDRRGREHYDDGRYAPQSYGGDDRYRPQEEDPYMPKGSWYPRYPGYPDYPGPRFPPRYDGNRGPEREVQPVKMHKIGFSVDGEMERFPDEFRRDYRSTVEHPRRDEMSRSPGSYMAGYGAGEGVRPMDKHTAEEWLESMKNEDGTTGPHWPMEKTKQVQSQKGIDADPLAFWVAMNMIYSDYAEVAKKLNVNSADFYACMAEAFLKDKDALPDKLERYYQFIVKK